MHRCSHWSAARVAGVALVLSASASAARPPADFLEDLRERARNIGAAEYAPRKSDDLPGWLADLDYDGYRRIRFRTETALWAGDGLPFRMGFAHRGYLFDLAVPMHVLDPEGAHELRFNQRQFQYGLEKGGEVPPDLGYAGLTILHEIESPGKWDEVGSFLGASYFRLLGREQRYGASARGLAIDTASSRGEEFPAFVELWVEKPAPDAEAVSLYALLDSPSAAGAYHFVITPGERTVADVRAYVYPRRAIEKLGLAPLTSMFLYGEERLRHFPDYRPEIHDSDGLLIADKDGGWLWRPLRNPTRQHGVTRFAADDPKGFGLLQRDRDFKSYQDLEAYSERRPSLWVTPAEPWGKGAVELIEIPSDSEGNDNVAAYWVPERSPAPGEELALRYAIASCLDDPSPTSLARVRATRVRPGGTDLFVLDFENPQPVIDLAQLRAEVTGAEVRNVVLQQNHTGGGLRLAFEVVGAGADERVLRALLLQEDRAVSETWVYPWRKP